MRTRTLAAIAAASMFVVSTADAAAKTTRKPKREKTTVRQPSRTARPAPEPAGINLLMGSVTTRNMDPRADGRDVNAAIAGANDFTIKLYKAVAADQAGQNVVTGPYTALFALGMAYGGARGQTADEMAAVLGAKGLPGERWHTAINAYDLTLVERLKNSGVEWTTANKIWVQRGLKVAPTYLDLMTGRYGAPVADADFATNSERERALINEWTKLQTKERIKELFPKGSIDAHSLLVLVNAVALDAPWNVAFDPSQTRNVNFQTLDGRTVSVPMMRNDQYLPSVRGDDFSAVELPYKGGHIVMDVIIPTDFATFEKELTAANLAERLSKINDGGIHLTMPKFSTRTHANLNDALKNMGMKSAFGAADFSGITDGPNDLSIRTVEHEAFIEVDEAGTKAAAATGVVIAISHGPTVNVDRPFLYVIRDKAAGTILFVGRVLDPTIGA